MNSGGVPPSLLEERAGEKRPFLSTSAPFIGRL
jgi:hypothetical protein